MWSVDKNKDSYVSHEFVTKHEYMQQRMNPVPYDNYFQSNISLRSCYEVNLHSRSNHCTVSIPHRSDIIYHKALIIGLPVHKALTIAGGILLVQQREIACCARGCENQQTGKP